ncbi:MAG: rRNA maturation RNase YbeY [Anaerolineaceae bacterium]|nr:rRNA maturation RNase YbeY [Anaerolineae bacterium]NLF11599.1 rRNA maturation RNase YbeY [Anaerolineaceae bacterium]
MTDKQSVVEIQVAEMFTGLVPVERLERAVMTTLRHEERPGEVTVVVTDDQGIRELNRDFMDEDEATDVLSFPSQEDGGPFIAAPGSDDYLGDVVISYTRAVDQALEQQYPVERELDLLVVHGVLHLLGYDHADIEERNEMWARQDEILAML